MAHPHDRSGKDSDQQAAENTDGPRSCSCHPSERPTPCPGKHAYRECMVAAALGGIEDDYMTSEKHHPAYVLIPVKKFEQLCAAAKVIL